MVTSRALSESRAFPSRASTASNTRRAVSRLRADDARVVPIADRAPGSDVACEERPDEREAPSRVEERPTEKESAAGEQLAHVAGMRAELLLGKGAIPDPGRPG